MVSAANRASLVSKYSWCGRPCDLEIRKSIAVSGHQERWEEEGQGDRSPCARWETFPKKESHEVTGPGLYSTESAEACPMLKHHTLQAGPGTCPW